MSIFYLYKLIEKMNSKEAIIEVLKIRGFLIEEHEGHYYFSDNAMCDDVRYLKVLLKKYKLGLIHDKNGYVTGSRRCWPPFDVVARSYVYKTIKPYCIEIVIYPTAELDDAIDLFYDMGRNGAEAGPPKYTWDRFRIEQLPPKTRVEDMESCVAFYGKAISACGVSTSGSCDGNHENGGSIFVFASYPYNIWHKCIWDFIITSKFGNIPYIGEKGNIKFSGEQEQADVYEMVYEIASFLYSHRMEIRKLKTECINRVGKKYIKKHTNYEIENLFVDTCRDVMKNIEII